jgi:hypothetical protein
MSCSIAALLAAISLLTQTPSNFVLANITACSLNSSSSACHRERAVAAEAREQTYRETVRDAVWACKDEEVFAELFPYCDKQTIWAGHCRVEQP